MFDSVNANMRHLFFLKEHKEGGYGWAVVEAPTRDAAQKMLDKEGFESSSTHESYIKMMSNKEKDDITRKCFQQGRVLSPHSEWEDPTEFLRKHEYHNYASATQCMKNISDLLRQSAEIISGDGWPKKLEEGRFTTYCKTQGFSGPCKGCAEKAMKSDDPSVRGMASFYLNTTLKRKK